jgi:hypothetical protein
MRWIVALSVACLATSSAVASPAQWRLPTTITIDGYPVSCRNTPIQLDPYLTDFGRARPGLIQINPAALQGFSTSYKLFIFSHECAHAMNIMNEEAADCFAARLGRQQGWWTRQGFYDLIAHMGNNPGSYTHAPGPWRIERIRRCSM